jgi:hypothetical protein
MEHIFVIRVLNYNLKLYKVLELFKQRWARNIQFN